MKILRRNIAFMFLVAAWTTLFLAPASLLYAEGAATKNIDKKLVSQLKSLKYETESQIKAELTPQFDKIFGYEGQWIQVIGQFDEARFLLDEGLVDSSGTTPDLPGISFNNEVTTFSLKSGPQIFKTYLKGIEITVYSRKEANPEVQDAARVALKRAFAALGEPKISIKFLLVPALPIEEREATEINFEPLNDSIKILSGKLGDVVQESKNLVEANKKSDFINKIFYATLAIELTVLLVAYVLFRRKSGNKDNFDRLSTTLSQIAAAISERSYDASPVAIQSQAAPASLPAATTGALGGGASSSSFSLGEEMINRIQSMLDNDPELALLAGYQLLQSGSYEDAFILMGAVKKELRNNICDRVGPKVMSQFNEFVRSRGSVFMSHSDDFHRRIQTLYQKIWPASQDRDSFIYSSLSEMLVKLDDHGTRELFKLLIPNEISAYVSICGPAKFASLVMANTVSLEECKDISSEPPSAKVIKSLFEKLTGIIRKTSDAHELVDPIFGVAEFLPQELEKQLLQSTGQSIENSLDSLLEAHFDRALELISNYDVADIAAILATFDDNTREKTLAGLPEIKARRVKNMTLSVQPRGLELKSKLQNTLREIGKEEPKEDFPHVA